MWWTFAAACVASVTAIVIAFIAYPWQRSRDRQLEIQKEKRALYKEVLAELSSLDNKTWGYEPVKTEYVWKPRAILDPLLLYAPEEVIDAVYLELEIRGELVSFFRGDSFLDLPNLAEKLYRAQCTTLSLMRTDLIGRSIDVERLSRLETILLFDYDADCATHSKAGAKHGMD